MIYLRELIAASRYNNLNVIRLFLALMVICSHAYIICYGRGEKGRGEPLYCLTHGQEALGTIAVNLFFFISGMLITASWLHSKSMQDYLIKRIIRIYPGFISALIFSGLTIWIFCPEFRAQVGHGISWSFLMISDMVFLSKESLEWKGIFANNPSPDTVNGSLWTIPKEFACYILVAVVGLFALYKKRHIILIGAFFAYGNYCIFLLKGCESDKSFTRLLPYFLIGMCVWLWRDKIIITKYFAIISLITLIICSQFKPYFSILFPICGSYLTLWLAYIPRLKFTDWTKNTDLSYGTYLYALPIQQIAAMPVSLRVPWINFLITAPVVLIIALISWNMIEKRFLSLKGILLVDHDPADDATKS
jgi:peptidoglycan/LPS O-acetylase OafA/YrhL